MKQEFSGQLKVLIEKAISGSQEGVDYIMNHLTIDSTLVTTRNVDYS